MYQGRSPNFREGENLTKKIEISVDKGWLKNTEIFVFTNNLVFESMFYNVTSS